MTRVGDAMLRDVLQGELTYIKPEFARELMTELLALRQLARDVAASEAFYWYDYPDSWHCRECRGRGVGSRQNVQHTSNCPIGLAVAFTQEAGK